MLYGSETWSTKVEDISKMQRSEMRMLRWMTGVSLQVLAKKLEYFEKLLQLFQLLADYYKTSHVCTLFICN